MSRDEDRESVRMKQPIPVTQEQQFTIPAGTMATRPGLDTVEATNVTTKLVQTSRAGSKVRSGIKLLATRGIEVPFADAQDASLFRRIIFEPHKSNLTESERYMCTLREGTIIDSPCSL
jgi:hypothetical protein